MTGLRIYLLGAQRVQIEGKTFAADRRKAIALLAYLAVTERAYSRETLATLLWPASDQSRALAYLRRTIWEINNGLGAGWLAVDREQVALRLEAGVWLDVAAFHAHVRANSMADLAAAAELYRDDFMAGFSLPDSPAFDDWQSYQTGALRRTLANVLDRLAANHALQGDGEAAIAVARRWLALDPLDEAAQRRLMRLYAAEGWRAAAIRQYEGCVQLLADELGVPPEPETEALYEQIVRGELAPMKGEPAASVSGSPRDSVEPAATTLVNLPLAATPFVGREPELDEIVRLLSDPTCRLLTLLGPGGSGKTRLAIESATRRAADAGVSVCFVPLAPLTTADLIVPAIASELHFSFFREEERGPREQLFDFLRQQRLLLILDNFEQLIAPDSVGLLLDILNTAPEVQLLITSRTRLNVQAEQLYYVGGMRVPDPELAAGWREPSRQAQAFSALQLFRERARRVRPGFELDPGNLAQVVEICRLVQGMPLGVELAAAWMELLSPAEIASEIRRSLDFLETDLLGVPERQRSLRAIFDSSWELLLPAERDVFQGLTVFRGSFTRDAVQAVTDASLRTLLALVNKSWLQRINIQGGAIHHDGDRPAGTQRYRVHELLRQYAGERLRADPETWRMIQQAHADYYGSWMAQQADALSGAGQAEALRIVLEEFGNVRAAWLWFIEQQDYEIVVDQMLAPLLLWAFYRYSLEEILPLLSPLDDVRPRGKLDPRRRAILSVALAVIISERWLVSEARERTQEAWRLVAELGQDGPAQIEIWYAFLALRYAWSVDRSTALEALRDFIPLLREKDKRWSLAWSLFAIGQVNASLHAWEEAMEALRESEALFRELGNQLDLVSVLDVMADVARTQGDYERALELLTRAKTLVIASGNRVGLANLAHTLAEVYLQLGDIQKALAQFREQQRLFTSVGNRMRALNALHWQCLLVSRYASLSEAKQIRQEQLEMARDAGHAQEYAWSLWETGELHRMGDDPAMALQFYQDSYTIMKERHNELGIGFYHRGLASLALARGDHDEAAEQFAIYLKIAEQEHYLWSVAYALAGLGRVAAAKGDDQRAEEYLIRSLRQAQSEGTRDLCMLALLALAEWRLSTGDTAEAVKLAGFVEHHHLTWRHVRERAADLLARAREELSSALYNSAEQRGRELGLTSLIEELTNAYADSQPGNSS